MKVPLSKIAHTRSGDKGDTSNIGVIAYDARHYPILVREVTAERVKAFFGDLVQGKVERYELPNLGALNFLLHEALGGGGTVSLRVDAQGKTFGAALLANGNRGSKPMGDTRYNMLWVSRNRPIWKYRMCFTFPEFAFSMVTIPRGSGLASAIHGR